MRHLTAKVCACLLACGLVACDGDNGDDDDAAACSADNEPDSSAPAPVFGAQPGPCGVTVLTNEIGDDEKLRAAVDCAIDEVDARSIFTWDLLVPTVEGDPILYRFAGDG